MQKRFVLTNWNIYWRPYSERVYAKGNVYNNPRFYKGREINTSDIINMEDEEKSYVIHTLNSIYELPKNSYKGNEEELNAVKELFFEITKKESEAFEKLLSRGDCLLYNNRLIYYSENGLRKICASKNLSYNVYSYPNENLTLVISESFIFDTLTHIKLCITGRNIDNNKLYVLDTDRYSLSVYSYNSILQNNPLDMLSD